MSDTELRELERAACSGDAMARVQFLRAAERSGVEELQALGALEEIVYHAAAYVLVGVQACSMDAVGIVKALGGRPAPSSSLTEDDVVSMLAACARRVAAGGVAAWDVRKSAVWPAATGVVDRAITVMAAKNERDELALGVRAETWFDEQDGFDWMKATVEAPCRHFMLRILPTRDDLREYRRAVREGRMTPAPFPYREQFRDEVSRWIAEAPEFTEIKLPPQEWGSLGLNTLTHMRVAHEIYNAFMRSDKGRDPEFFYTQLRERDPSDVSSYDTPCPVVAAHAALVARWAALWSVGSAR